ncbi:hypothetical protein J6590_057514 [Homalodisca vitripennis]|nr:hypothetical protein J6590_057514 [Homalodisca vitripennis]
MARCSTVTDGWSGRGESKLSEGHVAWRCGVLVLRAWEATELSLPLLEVAFHEPRDVTPRFMVGSLQGGRGWPSRLVGARKNLYLGQGPRTSLLQSVLHCTPEA